MIDDKDDIVLEAEVQHLISLVEDGILEVCKVEVLTLNVVDDATASSDENVHTTS